MLIEDLAEDALARRLRRGGIHLVTGAFTFHLQFDHRPLLRELAAMYGAYRVEDTDTIADASVRLEFPRWWRPMRGARAKVWIDDVRELVAPPGTGAYMAFESALNWSVATSDVAPLLLHAAVLERNGRALILPAPSGSGKSTLCAALACNGWRLFSDEMAIFAPEDWRLRPNPRPVSLKNRSIELIRERFAEAHLSPTITGTPKGAVAYMRAPRGAVARGGESAPASLVVKPEFSAGAALAVRRMGTLESFRLLTDNAVNYTAMLRPGFEAMTALAERAGAYALTYSALDDAIARIGELHDEHAAR